MYYCFRIEIAQNRCIVVGLHLQLKHAPLLAGWLFVRILYRLKRELGMLMKIFRQSGAMSPKNYYDYYSVDDREVALLIALV